MARESSLERLARRANDLAERYIPDAFVFALAGTAVVFVAALMVDPAARRAPGGLVDAWGQGFWTLIPFTLQMAMIIIGGYVLATAPPVYRFIGRLAGVARSPKGAVAFVAVVAMSTSLLNWGFSLIFSAILAREVARRVPDADYRALGAASFLGLGSVWAQGLSGSAALQMARAASMPPRLAEMVQGGIPLTETIFRWQSLAAVACEIVLVGLVMWRIAPGAGRGRTAADLGIHLAPPPAARAAEARTRPGDVFEHSPFVLLPFIVLGFLYLARVLVVNATSAADALNAIDFNVINLFLLTAGALLHRTPASLARSVRDAAPATAGVLLQFPFYGGIFGVMTGSHLSAAIASLFVRASTQAFYPAMIVVYSAVLGVFVPSGGSKWVIEAPYVLQAAGALQVPAGWIVVTYDLGEALANLLQPFWMLPILALLGLRARDIMGYTYLVALALFPLVLLLVTILRPAM